MTVTNNVTKKSAATIAQVIKQNFLRGDLAGGCVTPEVLEWFRTTAFTYQWDSTLIFGNTLLLVATMTKPC